MTSSHESIAPQERLNPFAGMSAEDIRGEHNDTNPFPGSQPLSSGQPVPQEVSAAHRKMALNSHPSSGNNLEIRGDATMPLSLRQQLDMTRDEKWETKIADAERAGDVNRAMRLKALRQAELSGDGTDNKPAKRRSSISPHSSRNTLRASGVTFGRQYGMLD